MNTPGKLTISVCDDKIIDQIPELQKQKLLSNMKTKKRQECGGLHYQLQLKLGIKYMITTNINVEDGLVNGAYGTLKWIDYDNIEPKTLWIDFGKNKKIGMKAKNAYKLPYPNISEKNLIPIQKTHIINNLKTGIQITRCQFPLTPAEAITIHKSQGETYDKVCLDVTKLNNKFTTNSLLYVAFSRVRCLENLYLIGEFCGMKKQTNAINEILENLHTNKTLQLSLKFDLTQSTFSIIYHNVRSLKQNFSYIYHDKWYSQTDVVIFSETYSKAYDQYDLKNYKLIYCSNIDDHKSKGISCFVKEGLYCQIINKKIFTELIENKPNHVELILLKIEKYYVITGYKSPSTLTTSFIEILNTFNLEKICSDNVIMVGDFNFDCFNEKNKMNDILMPYSLKRGLNAGITTTRFDTQIDIIYLSKNINNYESGTYESFFSDHKPIYLCIQENNDKKEKHLDTNKDNNILKIQSINNQKINKSPKITSSIQCLPTGLLNTDNVSCYANASIQLLLSSTKLKNILQYNCSGNSFSDNDKYLQQFYQKYQKNNVSLDTLEFRKIAHLQFLEIEEQDASEFLIKLIPKFDLLHNFFTNAIKFTTKCTSCTHENQEIQDYSIISLAIPSDNLNNIYTINDLINYNFNIWVPINGNCSFCELPNLEQKQELILYQKELLLIPQMAKRIH
ncbi:hypothetical protein TKK_0010275 [Trichogramma kaykai]